MKKERYFVDKAGCSVPSGTDRGRQWVLLPCSSGRAAAGQPGSCWRRQRAGQQRWSEWLLLRPVWLRSDRKHTCQLKTRRFRFEVANTTLAAHISWSAKLIQWCSFQSPHKPQKQSPVVKYSCIHFKSRLIFIPSSCLPQVNPIVLYRLHKTTPGLVNVAEISVVLSFSSFLFTSSLLTSRFLIAFCAAALVAMRRPSAASRNFCCCSSLSGFAAAPWD